MGWNFLPILICFIQCSVSSSARLVRFFTKVFFIGSRQVVPVWLEFFTKVTLCFLVRIQVLPDVLEFTLYYSAERVWFCQIGSIFSPK